ncbi:response regulator, partial [Klebsiella pneumoniae]|uniref:response regulator n=1 Tax=Klebsiella pneumoniae TaxID=573 RepID=UPI003EE1E238
GNHGTAERPRRIILVDDDPLQLKALALLLTRAGHQVLTANSAATALELARREHPDMVLADILMPGTDGFTLCRQIRTDPVLGDIPVILITA